MNGTQAPVKKPASLIRAGAIAAFFFLGPGSVTSHAVTPAAPVSAPGNLGIAGSTVIYTTRSGDTLSSIALRMTGNGANWSEIGRVNGIDNEVRIPVGTKVRIPATLLADERIDSIVAAASGKIAAVLPDGRTLSVSSGQKLPEGASIDTGPTGFLTLALADGSRISLPSQTRIRLEKLRRTQHTGTPRTEIALLQGKVESRVASLGKNGGQFDVRTPFSVTSVRGTHFKVGLSGSTVTNEVLSGSVDVSWAEGAGIRLRSGMGNIVSAGGVAAPRDLLGAPGMEKLTAIDTAVQLALAPVAGASAYRVQIARDSDGQDVIADQRAALPAFRFDRLKHGGYYARISAIDAIGLEGQSHLHAFRIGASGEVLREPGKPGSPVVTSDGQNRLLLSWSGSSDQRFLVQIARDPDFSWLITTAEAVGPRISLPRPAFGTYYARIRAIGQENKHTPYSLAQGFIVSDHWVIHDGTPAAAGKSGSGSAR